MKKIYWLGPKRKVLLIIVIPSIIFSTIFSWLSPTIDFGDFIPLSEGYLSDNFIPKKLTIEPFAQFLSDYPVVTNLKDKFTEQGRRLQLLKEWVELNDIYNDTDFLENTIEKVASSMFPFIKNPFGYKDVTTPFSFLRRSYIPDSKGIVIPAGKKNFRYAIHLGVVIREVFNCTLPIQIAYAGKHDLPFSIQEIFLSVVENVRFLDVTHMLSSRSLDLEDSEWAIKVFSALVCNFEQTLVVDADVVLVQSPEVLFQQKKYLDSGALFFHDRLTPKKDKSRINWWHSLIEYPSEELSQTPAWSDEHSEQAHSGVVVLDKSRLSTFIGLLHTCWQNTPRVRTQATYKLMHGDKESWWLGFELTNSSYAFEKHNAAIIGNYKQKEEDGEDHSTVCSHAVAHVDEDKHLLWYDGSLLKDKNGDPTKFDIPKSWMMDGEWEDKDREQLNCMTGAEVHGLSDREKAILSLSVELAKKYDEEEELLED